MKNAIIAAIILAVPALAATYQDPQHRFTLDVPAGWTAEPFGEGVKIGRSTAYCLVMEGQAASPEALVNHLAGQFGGQWSRFQPVQQGRTNIGGQAAPFTLNSGINPKGVPSYIKVAAISTQGRLLGLIESAPAGEYTTAKPAFDQIEQGFRLASATTATAPSSRLIIGMGIDQAARVGSVTPSGPAATAGIRAGDQVVSINRNPIAGPRDMRSALSAVRPGDTLEVVILRDGHQYVASLHPTAGAAR